MPERVYRRDLLQIGGVIGTGIVAGCIGDGETDDDADGVLDDDSDPNSNGESHADSNGDPKADPRPITGNEVPELATLDETILEYMRELDVPAGVLGVMNDGEIVLERGYGWADRDRTTPIEPDTLFRIASISKPITDAAIQQLIKSNILSLDERVFPLLAVEPPAGEPEDDRFHDVRVEHLLAHSGGWNQFIAGDPMYEPVEVTTKLGLDGPPDKYDITRYMLDQPMQFDPGESEVYSNFGYSLLGQVIEGATGMEYQSYLDDAIFGPAGVEGIEIGRTRPENRHPDEIWYDDDETCSNAFELDTDASATCADYGFVVEAFDAAGGHVGSTRSLLSYLDAYWLTGEARTGDDGNFAFFGSHPGSFSFVRQRPDGISAAAMFNSRQIPLDPFETIFQRLDDALDDIDTWP